MDYGSTVISNMKLARARASFRMLVNSLENRHARSQTGSLDRSAADSSGPETPGANVSGKSTVF